MDRSATTRDFLLDQCARYPALRSRDLLKFLHQSVLGCGHFITDETAAWELLLHEWAQPGPTLGVEPLDGPFCRVHLGEARRLGLMPRTLFRLFLLSAQTPAGDVSQLPAKLTELTGLDHAGLLPFPAGEMTAAAAAWQAEGCPVCRHSPEFRAAYRPTYRVLRREFYHLLPLFAAIDREMAHRKRLLVAIEGGSASGKSTLGRLLQRVYGCSLFHMDDFFLQPQQRTPERLAEPGGNVDRERFWEEVLRPLSAGEPVRYRRYDCHTQTLVPPTEVLPGPLAVVEGAYSLHPALAETYDLTVFLRISPELQRQRILNRNGPEAAERFFSTWVPLENAYFAALDPASRCDLILEVTE